MVGKRKGVITKASNDRRRTLREESEQLGKIKVHVR